jgi:hypothetical protein
MDYRWKTMQRLSTADSDHVSPLEKYPISVSNLFRKSENLKPMTLSWEMVCKVLPTLQRVIQHQQADAYAKPMHSQGQIRNQKTTAKCPLRILVPKSISDTTKTS